MRGNLPFPTPWLFFSIGCCYVLPPRFPRPHPLPYLCHGPPFRNVSAISTDNKCLPFHPPLIHNVLDPESSLNVSTGSGFATRKNLFNLLHPHIRCEG